MAPESSSWPGSGAQPLLHESMPPWRVFLDPRGRISRSTYWLYGIGGLLGLALLLHALLDIARVPQGVSDPLVNLLLLWPAFATSAKRWHDRDKSAWWVLVTLVPVVGSLWALVVTGFLRGTVGANRYGEDPLALPAAANWLSSAP